MSDNVEQPGFFAARPTVRIDGELQEDLGDNILKSMMVEETTLGLFRCEASFVNWGPAKNEVTFPLFDRERLYFGKTLSVEVGPQGQNSPVFAGRITGIEAHYLPGPPPELLVLAEDRFQDLRMERRTRSFENITDADLIRQIATQHGLKAEIDVVGPTHRVLAQVNQSDLAFLRERVAAIDAELWVDDRTLYAQARTKRKAGSVAFTYGENLKEFSVLADLAHQRSAVQVSGWDVGGKEAIDVKADEKVIKDELRGGRSGSAVLAQALAERRERIVSAVPLSPDEAQKMAEARYRERARRFVSGSGVVDGNIKLRVGATVELKGLGVYFDGPYYVTRARHTFTLQEGYHTAFDVQRPAIGG
jgi:phage protein D